MRAQIDLINAQWQDTLGAMQQTQRSVEVSLVQWTSFEENHEQVRAWIEKMESQVLREWPLASSLEEKTAELSHISVLKRSSTNISPFGIFLSPLQMFQSLNEDIENYKRVLQNFSKKSEQLVQTENNPELTKNVTKLADRYVTVANTATVRPRQFFII